MSKFIFLLSPLYFLLSTNIAKSQTDTSLEDILAEDNKDKKETVYAMNAFKSTRVINGHSMEMLGKGVLDFRILHRFGQIDGGWRELFGLDQASMRMGFDYGITKNITIGYGRSTFNKEYDGFVKYRIAHQHKGEKNMPVSILWTSGITLSATKISDSRLNKMANRIGYYHQAIVGRKFSDEVTVQISPTLVHRNMVETKSDFNDMLAIGVGTRLKFTKRMALVVEGFPILYGTRKGFNQPSESIGLDIETGGHVFQVHVSNSRGMNEKAFITETTQKWDKLQVNFGFNLSRVFTIVKNKATSW